MQHQWETIDELKRGRKEEEVEVQKKKKTHLPTFDYNSVQ
jgi:hypothetical protein